MPHATAALLLALPLALAAQEAGQETKPETRPEMGWTGVLDEEAFAALHELRAGAAPARRGERVEVAGTSCYLTRPQHTEPVGAVLVIHEWWGLNEHVEHQADRIADDGYVALAVDLYGGKVATTREEAMGLMTSIDEEAALETLRAAHAFLLEDERVAAERTACIGWCFGGHWSLRLAMAEPQLDAAVMYYGRLVTDVERLRAIEAPMLGIFGTRDEGIPPAKVAEFEEAMKAAGNPLELHSYDAHHAFANPSGARYDAANAAAAWRETRAFLAEHLWPALPEGTYHQGTRQLAADAPAGWELQEPRPMRLVSYSLGDGAECYVSAFPGDTGGLKANLDRWRRQLGAPPLEADALDELPRVVMLGELAVFMRVEGDYRGMGGEQIPGAALLGAVCPLEEETLFVKLLGPKELVAAQEDAFVRFCQRLR